MQKILVFRRECLSLGSQRNDCLRIHATFLSDLQTSQQRQKFNMNIRSIRSRIICQILLIFFNFTVFHSCYFLFILSISGPIQSADSCDFLGQKIFNHIADCFVVFDTILFSDSCIFLFVSHTFNLITKAYPPIRKRYHPRFKKWWIYDILSSFDRFRFWKRFSNKWKSLQMAARIKGKMERTSSWSYLCRRIGFLTAAPRVVQPRRIAAQDWLSHSKLSISRQSQNNSFPLKVYTSVASSKLYNCYVFIFVYILFDRPSSKLWKVAWFLKYNESQKKAGKIKFLGIWSRFARLLTNMW